MRENDNFFNLSHPYFIKHIKKTIFILLTYAKKPTPKAQNAKEVFMSGQSLYSLSGTVVPTDVLDVTIIINNYTILGYAQNAVLHKNTAKSEPI